MSGDVGFKIGARIELTLVKGCPNCTHNQFFVVAGSEDPVQFYWLTCSKCGTKGKISDWPFEPSGETQPVIVYPSQSEAY